MDGSPYAIDNANIANIQKVSAYGASNFVRKFYTPHYYEDGSIKNSIKVEGDGNQTRDKLKKTFGEELPEFYQTGLF